MVITHNHLTELSPRHIVYKYTKKTLLPVLTQNEKK